MKYRPVITNIRRHGRMTIFECGYQNQDEELISTYCATVYHNASSPYRPFSVLVNSTSCKSGTRAIAYKTLDNAMKAIGKRINQ